MFIHRSATNHSLVRAPGERDVRARRRLGLLAALVAAVCAFAVPASPAFGEGSLNVNTGPGTAIRHGLSQTPNGYTVLRVYAQAGEEILMGSSAMGLIGGLDNIMVYAPGTDFRSPIDPDLGAVFPTDPVFATDVFDCNTDDPGTGRIASRAEEGNGPLPNAGGYDACTFVAPADGIYSVVMVGWDPSSTGGTGTVNNPDVTTAQNREISIWDVTVRDAGVDLWGRVYSNFLSLRSHFDEPVSAWRSLTYTRTGHVYFVDMLNAAGLNWALTSDDRGNVDPVTGLPLYASYRNGEPAATPAHDRHPDLADDDRHPTFFNMPDPVVFTGTGGLGDVSGFSSTPIAPSSQPLSDPTFTGADGTSGATSQGSGGTISFTSPEAMDDIAYELAIDVNNDGTFGNANDVIDGSGELSSAGNTFAWDGLDANGIAPPCGTYPYQVSASLSEVHFTLSDMENFGGMRLARLTLPADPDLGDQFAASYNDVSPFTGTAVTNTAPSAVANGSSESFFHAWTALSGDGDFVDTWTRLPEIVEAGSLQILCPDPAVVKSAPGTVDPGGQVTWTLTVTNHGPGVSSSSTVTDTVPAGVTNVASSTPGCSVAGNTVTCAVGELAAGASTQITITGTAPSTASTCFTNESTVTGDPGQGDANPANNSSTATTCTTPPPPGPANVTIDKTVSDQRVLVGETLTYRLVVRNAGPGVPTDVEVEDELPSRLDALSVSSSQGTCRLSGNRVDCQVGTMAVGQEVTITVRARAIRAGEATNTASVTSERCPANPCDTDPARVRIVKPSLRLTKQVGRRVLRAGETTSYTIRVSNPSDVRLRNVRTCDRLPAGLVYVSSNPRARLSGGRHCWTIRRLAGGASRTYRVTVRALAGAGGRLVNTATATSPDARRAQARRAVRVIANQVAGGGVTG